MDKQIKKITLIEPAPPNYHIYENWKLPRLGLPIIGELLRQRGYDVRIYNLDVGKLDAERFRTSDMVGISSITSTIKESYRLAQSARGLGIPVVIGGPHVTFLPEEALQYADFVVRGEGEETIVELVEALNQGKDWKILAGLSYRDNNEVVNNPPRNFIRNLDSLPGPNLNLIQNSQEINPFPIISSRGCPYDCIFCSVVPMFGRGYRCRSVGSILDEIERYRPPYIFFYDDNFAANPSRTKELLKEMLRRKLCPKEWSAQCRIEVTRDKELLDLMRQTNCFFVFVGFESINPETLKAYNKQQTLEEISSGIGILHRYGIRVHGMFVFGSDSDTVATLHQTARFSIRYDIDTVQYLILTPLPGTRLYQGLESAGRIFSKDWSLYDGHHVVFYPERMSPYELQVETFRAYSTFYSRKQYLQRWLNFRIYDGNIRFYGRHLLRKWEKTNQNFIRNLKRLRPRPVPLPILQEI